MNNTDVEVNSLPSSNVASPQRWYLLMVAIFVFGMWIFRAAMSNAWRVPNLFFRRRARRAEDGHLIAGAALDILKQISPGLAKAPPSSPLQKFYQHIKENAANSNLDPLEVINRMQKIGVTPDLGIYNSLLEACIGLRKFTSAYHLFMEIKEPGSLVAPDVVTYNIYLHGVVEAINSGEHIDLSIINALLKEMVGKDLRPNVSTFNTVLEICAISGQSDLAWQYFGDMQREHKLEPDLVSYGTMIRMMRLADVKPYYFAPFFARFIGFFNAHPEAVDDQTINGIIDICGRLVDIEKIEKLLETLGKIGRKMSLASYGRLLGIYGQQRRGRKVEELVARMRQDRVRPNEVTYGCLMESYLRCDMLDKVEEVFAHILSSKGLVCNIIIYTTLIRALAKQRNFARVMEIYERLKRDPTCRPNRIAYNALLNCCIRCEQYQKMTEIFANMVAASEAERKAGIIHAGEENSVEPDLITYSTLIKGLCKADCMDKAMGLYGEMRGKGMQLDEVLFNSLLDGLAKSRQPLALAQSTRVIEDMRNMKIGFSNYTYSILVKLYARRRELDKALGVLSEMRANGVKPGVVVYTCLIQTCIRGKMVDKAVELFAEMRGCGVEPDAVTYNTIVNGCIFSGRLPAACSILAQAIDQSVRLADDIYNNVLRNLLTYHRMSAELKHEYASKICNYIATHKIAVSQEYYGQVMSTLVLQQEGGLMYYPTQTYGYYPPQYFTTSAAGAHGYPTYQYAAGW